MKEDLTIRVLNGEQIYPYMNGKIIKINKMYDLRECFKYILNDEKIKEELNNYKKITRFSEFNKMLLEDKEFLDIIKTYFDNNNIIISDKDGEYIFEITLIDKEDHDYTLRLLEGYCNLNREHFLCDYIDIFGNKIIFK